jgi:L-fucose isomerase-like protein
LAAAIAKQLGVNPTDKDFQASLEQFAKNTDDPKASLLFIEQMKDKFSKRQKINEEKRLAKKKRNSELYKKAKELASNWRDTEEIKQIYRKLKEQND